MYYTHLYGEIRKSTILLYMVFGDTLSPTLFGLYVNDLVETLNNTNSGISIGILN